MSLELQRYGRGPDGFPYILTALPDGYWTPWHLADQQIRRLETRVEELEAGQAVGEAEDLRREVDGLRDLLHRMLEAPTTQVSVTWKDAVREALGSEAGQPAAQADAQPFNPAAKCSPTLTQCPRCNNPHHACDGGVQADAQPVAPIEDPVTVPRGLLGAACAAIDRKHDAPKTLAELRRYTVGDLSAAAAPPARQPLTDEHDPVVGHKTFRDGPLGFRHEPLRSSEAAVIMAAVESADKRRAELMPDEKAAIRLMFEARQRLIELGWNDAIYCPKDGGEFDAIEAGSTGIHRCHYSGEWPNGSWWVADDGDLYPSRPVLYRNSSPGGIGREGE